MTFTLNNSYVYSFKDFEPPKPKPQSISLGPNNDVLVEAFGHTNAISWERLRDLFLHQIPYPMLFPSHTIHAQEIARNHVKFLIEMPPGIYPLTVENDDYNVDGLIPFGTFNIAVPWSYFGVIVARDPYGLWKISGKYVFWARNRVSNLSDLVLPGKIPNIRDSGSICMGYTKVNRDGASCTENINDFIAHFWESPFNGHLGWRLPDRYRKEDNPYLAWQEDSEKDAYCYLSWPDWERASPYLSEAFPTPKPITQDQFFASVYSYIQLGG